MIELADTFPYELSTVVYIVGSAVLLNICALVAVWSDRVPANIAAFELTPAFGL
jgi:hypothetical protein